MELSPDDPKTWLTAALGLLAAAWAWTGNRLVKQLDSHGRRLAKLEADVAKKAELTDVGQVYERLASIDERFNSRLTTLSDRMSEQHVELLEAIYENRKDAR